MTLKHIIPIMIIGAYAPTAQAEQHKKDQFYDALTNLVKEHQAKHIIHILGDFNARIQHQLGDHEECVGPHTFNKANVTIQDQTEEVEDNRLRFIAFCTANSFMIMNTVFQNHDKNLATWKYPGTQRGPPWERPRYEMIDYMCTMTRWKNSVKNCETDPDANITSDHFPMWATIRTKPKAEKTEHQARVKYWPCSAEQHWWYNEAINQSGIQGWKKKITQAAVDNIPAVKQPEKKDDISLETDRLIKERGQAIMLQKEETQIADITKRIRTQRKRDKQAKVQEELSHKLDTRDWWATVRRIRKAFTPKTYALKNSKGKRIQKKDRAEECAKFLEEDIWGNIAGADVNSIPRTPIGRKGDFNTEEIHMSEVTQTLR